MNKIIALSFAVALAAGAASAEEKKAEGGKTKSAAELEKEKAMAEPYANDLGPTDIDEIAKGYPAVVQDGYKLLKARCAQCHQPSRPLNSQFVETDGKDMAQRTAALNKLKKEKPELFKDKNVWQVEDNIWQRYVKRMMSKPGCKISADEGKKIWGFLVHDSVERKLKSPEKWEAHRKGLLEKFKKEHPERYATLYGGGEEKGKGKGGK